jgi:uncharacterized phage-associated protein
MFNERKVAQVAAYFLRQVPGRRMAHLKLMKLLYLSDREAIRTFSWPVLGDRLVSMPHGPVLSQTLDLMDGNVESQAGGWEHWISDKEDHEVSLRDDRESTLLDELSPAETDVLEAVWAQFGGMSKWEIRDWTHEHCAEWQDPRGSSLPITYESLARAVGFDKSAATELAARIQAEQEIDRLFESL